MATDVRHTSSLLRAACLIVGLASFASGCGGAPSRPDTASQQNPREAEAQKAFEAAQRQNTIEAYEAVMKRFEGTDAAGLARIEVARLSSDLSRVAVGRGDWEDARMLASRALELGDPIIAQTARTTLDQVDRADAREATERVNGALEMDGTIKGCAKAIQIVGSTLGPNPSKLMVRDLRKATLPQLSSCVQKAIQAAKPDDDYAPVREALTSDDAKQAFGEDTQFSVLTTLNNAVVAAMRERTREDVEAGRWKEAFEVFEAWQKEGKAGPQQVEAAKQKARDAITAGLLKRGKEALGKRTAPGVLADVDRALQVFEGMNVSGELKELRAHLATWVTCSELRCLAERTPRLMYNFGATDLRPPTSTTGEATKRFPNGTKLWVLARSRTFSLVTDEDPGGASTWEQRMAKAKGWVATPVLEREDTATWLPTGEALVGERVWLPTGRDDKLYLLGVVKAVDGKDVTVEKISDGQTTKVTRNDLRSGILSKGTKVLAFCRDTINLSEALIEDVVKGNVRAPRAELVCLEEDGSEGRKRQEQLGALRAKPAWLPPRRP